ncbi:hypothetical protein Hdeb2414_s0408g00887701 [Helianthus debilis subsp. tardiflorus]
MIPVLPFYTCFICFLPIFSNISKEIYRHRKETGEKRCERKQKERERERSGAGESPATGPTPARLPHTETKSPSLGFPARVPIKTSSSGNFRLTFLSCMLAIWLDRLSMNLNVTSHADLWSRLPPARFQ